MAKRKHVDMVRSLPASSDEQGRPEPALPSSDEQSGSAGRPTVDGKGEQGKDTGQDRYGQSGLGGKQGVETIGQASYRRSGPDGGQIDNPRSNHGSGRADRDSQDSTSDDDGPRLPKNRPD
ncbi:MAG TPA: hypothetical protein VFO82_13925 [Steroidobacteraceae bacterium]|nr:hypothetical protein [Steroidobacteraceae bacterium]